MYWRLEYLILVYVLLVPLLTRVGMYVDLLF